MGEIWHDQNARMYCTFATFLLRRDTMYSLVSADLRVNNKAIDESRLRPPSTRNALFAFTAKLRCIRPGSQPRDVSQRKATQKGMELKR